MRLCLVATGARKPCILSVALCAGDTWARNCLFVVTTSTSEYRFDYLRVCVMADRVNASKFETLPLSLATIVRRPPKKQNGDGFEDEENEYSDSAEISERVLAKLRFIPGADESRKILHGGSPSFL